MFVSTSFSLFWKQLPFIESIFKKAKSIRIHSRRSATPIIDKSNWICSQY